MKQVFPKIDNPADFEQVEGLTFAVFAEQYGEMVLSESGFTSPGEAAEFAAKKYGLGNWEVREFGFRMAEFRAIKAFWESQGQRRELRYTPDDREPFLLYYPAGVDCARKVGYYSSLEAVARSVGYEA